MKYPIPLATKTVILLTAIMTSGLVAAGFFLLHFQEESLKQTIFKGVDGQAQIAARGIAAFADEGLRASHAVSSTMPVNALLGGKSAEITSHLHRMFKAFPQFKNGIFILDKDGKFLADFPSHPELRGHSFAYREYYRRTIEENKGIIGKPYRSVRTGQPVLTFTAPVRNSHGQTVAIAACSIDLLSREALGGYLRQKFGDTGYLFIFDRERQLVLHPDDQRLLTYVEAGKNRILEAALKGFEGGGETVNSLGVPMLMSVRQVPGTEWIVAVQVPQKEAYATIAETRVRIISMSGIAILVIIFIGYAAIRRVTKPLQQLESVVSRISTELAAAETKGVYAVDDSSLAVLRKIHSSDEIGLLASSFMRLTERLGRALSSLRRAAGDWELTFNSVNEAVVTLDMNGRIVRMNRAAEDMFRVSANKVLGENGYGVIFGADAPPPEWPELASLTTHRRFRWSQQSELPRRVFEFTITPVIGLRAVTGAVLVIDDVTEQVESEERIREMAFYDQLTGLPNRFLLRDRINQAIVSAARSRKKAGIMFLDLDHFKGINDSFGHDAGDDVLKEAANRISACLRKNDTLARIGGDEFVVVLQDIEDIQEAAAVAKRIVEGLALSMVIKGHEMKISSSIGIALAPDDGEDGETLLKNADIAMYRAKRKGRNNYQYFA